MATDISLPLGSLTSEAAITDDSWHHVGLEFDGSEKRIYVDRKEVAKDSRSVVHRSTGGLYFGVNKDSDADSCVSGLIDDVRIYKVALGADDIKFMAH